MTRIEPSDPPRRLTEMPYDRFYQLVDADVRKKLEPEIAAKLRDGEVLARWLGVLRQMRSSVEGSIAARAAITRAERLPLVNQLREREAALSVMRRSRVADGEDYERLTEEANELCTKINTFTAKHELWRSRSLRFRNAVIERLTEAEWLQPLDTTPIPNDYLDRADFLIQKLEALLSHDYVTAIRRHRSGIEPEDATDSDRELWLLLPDSQG